MKREEEAIKNEIKDDIIGNDESAASWAGSNKLIK